jgi:hypothetical protein
VCLGILATSTQSVINRAVVIIPVDRAKEQGKLVACVVHPQKLHYGWQGIYRNNVALTFRAGIGDDKASWIT